MFYYFVSYVLTSDTDLYFNNAEFVLEEPITSIEQVWEIEDQLIKEVDLVSTEELKKNEISYTVHVFKTVTLSWQFWTAIGISAALLIVYLVLIAHIRNKNKNRRVKKYRRM